MEIEFNPSRATQNGASQSVSRREVAPSANDNASFDRAGALEKELREIPLVRPEKVEQARALYKDVKYPPDEMLDRISSLLAMHITP
jgi:hypothetical protein